jgi:probable phosphoglycerate mutase
MARRVRSLDLGNPFETSLEGMCELLLVRHAEQEMYENIPLGEAFDSPLSERGVAQAEALASRLSGTRVDAVLSSSTLRASATARAVAEKHRIEPEVVDALGEIDLWGKAPQEKGLLDLLTRDEIVGIYREMSRTRRFSAFPYCEDGALFRQRICTTIDRLAREREGQRVVIVAHGGVINVYLSELFGSPYDQLLSLHHTSITTVRSAGGRKAVLSVNDYTHVFAVQDSLNEIIP